MGKYHFTYLINKTETHDLRDENEVVNEIDMRKQLEESYDSFLLHHAYLRQDISVNYILA